MCYFCSCFGWVLDFAQRGVTFFLTCWLGLVICIGLVIATGAGIAYGYNYCMAEFLTFGKSDVTVYMRRGQFRTEPLTKDEGYQYPAPYIEMSRKRGTTQNITANSQRRFGNEDDENYEMVAEYDDGALAEPRPLSKTWSKAKDTRQYAERLSNYANRPRMVEEEVQVNMPTTPAGYYLLTSPLVRRVTGPPVPLAATTMWKTGSSQIVMRRFQPVDAYVTTPSHLKPLEGIRENDEFFYRVSDDDRRQTMYAEENRPTLPEAPLHAPNRQQDTYKYIPMRHWGATTPETPVIPDELMSDQGDEESIPYKMLENATK